MREERREKRIAAVTSVVIHILVFFILAGSGIFSFLREPSQTQSIEVTLYHEDSSNNLPKAGAHGDAEIYYSPSYSVADVVMPDTAEHKKNSHAKAIPSLNENVWEEGGAATVSSDSLVFGGFGNGRGQTWTGNSFGSSKDGVSDGGGIRPETKAVLIYIPDVSDYYPENLRKKQITGTVGIRIIISSDGTVAEAVVASSSGYAEMDDAAMEIAWQCRYDPARNMNGEAVPAERNLNIPFEIK